MCRSHVDSDPASELHELRASVPVSAPQLIMHGDQLYCYVHIPSLYLLPLCNDSLEPGASVYLED